MYMSITALRISENTFAQISAHFIIFIIKGLQSLKKKLWTSEIWKWWRDSTILPVLQTLQSKVNDTVRFK
jgi:hypothetical protein